MLAGNHLDRKRQWRAIAQRFFGKKETPTTELSTWDRRWMDMALLVASWSKDLSRQTGAVIVDSNNTVVSLGWNGFPRGVDDSVDDRYRRPGKYAWTEHAERNAVFNAAANGKKTRDCTMYVPWFPCADCARSIIQAGIVELVCGEPDWADPRWAEDFEVAREMLAEVGMVVRFMPDLVAPVAVAHEEEQSLEERLDSGIETAPQEV